MDAKAGSGEEGKRAQPGSGTGQEDVPARKRVRFSMDSTAAAGAARSGADPLDGGISDGDLNRLYDRLLKTNPEFARREAAAKSGSPDTGVSDKDLNDLYDRLLRTNPEFARREAEALAAANAKRSGMTETRTTPAGGSRKEMQGMEKDRDPADGARSSAPATRQVISAAEGAPPLNPSRTFVPIRPSEDGRPAQRGTAGPAALPELPAMPAAETEGMPDWGPRPLRLPPRIARRPEAFGAGQGTADGSGARAEGVQAVNGGTPPESPGSVRQPPGMARLREEDFVTPPPREPQAGPRGLDERSRADRGRSGTPW